MNKLCEKVRHGLAAMERNKRIPDRIFAALLALCPILHHYIGPVFNMGITVLVVVAVYLIARMLQELPKLTFSKISFVLVMVIYQAYRIINHGTTLTEFGQSGVCIIIILGVAFGKLDLKFMMKVCRVVCLAASVGLVLQTVIYYLFEVHLQLVPTGLLTSNAEQWIPGAQTGLISITGRKNNFYRPSAFFLEPAHVYVYMFPHLILLLFTEKFNKKTIWMAGLITLGMVLCTSGMGIAAALGIWAVFLILRDDRDGTFSFKNIFRKRNYIAVGILVAAAALVIIFVPAARKAVTRIFVPNKFGTTAITGRIEKALGLLAAMSPLQWIFGVADNTHDITFHIPSFIDVIYRHGLLGFVLSYELYVKCILKQKLPYQFIGVIILITSVFSAHTHSTIGMLNFLLVLMSGFQTMDPPQPGVQPYRCSGKKRSAGKFLSKLPKLSFRKSAEN